MCYHKATCISHNTNGANNWQFTPIIFTSIFFNEKQWHLHSYLEEVYNLWSSWKSLATSSHEAISWLATPLSNVYVQYQKSIIKFICKLIQILPLIARLMGPKWCPSGADRAQVGPMLAPWTLLSGTPYVTLFNTIISLVFHGAYGIIYIKCKFHAIYVWRKV